MTAGQEARVRHLSLSDLLPPTDDYMTYDGSMTRPGCHETITWIVMNKPIYVTLEQVRELRLVSWFSSGMETDATDRITILA